MPTLRERLGAWIGGTRGSTGPVAFHPMQGQFFGQGMGNQPSHDVLLRENIGIADASTRAIAARLSTLNPQVLIKQRVSDGTEVEEVLDDHPLKVLLDRPHPDFSRAQMLRLVGQWIVTVGEAYLLKVGNGFGVPTELHPIPPGGCWPILEGGVVGSWGVRDGKGRISTLPADTVIRFYFPDPENIWGSEGYFGPSALAADSLKFSGEHLRSHYQNDATPKSYIKPGADAPEFSPEAKTAFLEEWRVKYHQRAGTHRGGPGMLPTGYDLVTLALASGADIVPLLSHWRDDELMAFGVPRSILGQVVSGDRSSAETNQFVFDLHTILPIAMLVANTLTLRLAPDFDPSLIVRFEQFVSEDKRFWLEQEQSDLDRKVVSVNMVHDERGTDHVDWGDFPVGQIGQVPYDGMSGFELAEDQADALGGEEDEERTRGKRPSPADYDSKEDFMQACIPVVMAEGKTSEQAAGQCSGMWENRSARAAIFFSPEAEWLRQVQREKKYVPTFRKEMLGILAIQERTTLKRLEEQQPRARIAAEDIFTPEEWAQLFERRVEPIREKAFLDTAKATFGGLGVEAEFVLTDAMREVLKEQGAQLIKHANQTTKKLIARQLEAAVAEGEGVDSIAKRIKSVFTTRRHHARTIARTEVLKSSQTAQIESFEQSGVVEKKQWNTSMDAAVRPHHTEVEGQTVGLREAFTLTTPTGVSEQADAPGIGLGGTTLSAANSINCRCFVTPVVEG